MSGCGRKHRAKHLVRQYLDDEAWEGPEKAGDILAVCIAAPSAKHVHVVVVDPPTESARANETQQQMQKDVTGEATTEQTDAKVVKSSSEADEVASGSVPLALPPRTVADLPGKFKKVLWLGCGDLIVLRLGSVHYKPSPPQLKYFYSTPEGKAWEESIKKAEAAAREYFKIVQSSASQQQLANPKNISEGKFVARKAEGGNDVIEPKPSATSANAASPIEQNAYPMDGSDDDLNAFVNPNRQSIKHRREAFFPDEDEEDEENNEEGEEEEREEDE